MNGQRPLPEMAGGGEFARGFNALSREVRANRLSAGRGFSLRRTPNGVHLDLVRTGGESVAVSRVVVLEASTASGPTDFDALTYAVELIDEQQSLPDLGGDPAAPIHRVCDMVRFGETFDDGNGGTVGWQVDPARPGTYGEAITYPAYDAQGNEIPGETRTVVRLFDERVSIRGC